MGISNNSPKWKYDRKIRSRCSPHDEDGNEFDEVPETSSELIGQCLQYKVCIYEVKSISSNGVFLFFLTVSTAYILKHNFSFSRYSISSLVK